MVRVKRPSLLTLAVFLAVFWALSALALLIVGVVLLTTTQPLVVQVRVPPPAPVVFPAGPVNNHPGKAPAQDRSPAWVRIDAPAGYGLVLRSCLGADGVYESQSGSVAVVPHDPECLTPDPPAKSVKK
jgi:hypothetical protein